MDNKTKEPVQAWLDGNFDPGTRKAVADLQARSPDDLNDAFYRTLEFGTGGLRGIMGVGTNRINQYTVGMATQGFANYLKAQVDGEIRVAIAFDSRNNSQAFAEITANVMGANGIKVYLFERLCAVHHPNCPLPLVTLPLPWRCGVHRLAQSQRIQRI